MAKRKATSPKPSLPCDIKKVKLDSVTRPVMKAKIFDESDSSDNNSESGAEVRASTLKINEEFAKRFEHNKKREELQKLEEKYEKSEKKKTGKEKYGEKYDEDSESSSDDDEEEEDDAGILITETLDAEISATLHAIRSKDPAVYDENFSFYRSINVDESLETSKESAKSKPMYLRDYHRENLLKGNVGEDSNESPDSQTFTEEQNKLQSSIIKEMHEAAAAEKSESDKGEDFLVPKIKSVSTTAEKKSLHKSKTAPVVDVTTADKDPETFLSNFMAARAWIPNDETRFQPLESDDDSEEDRAEKFESAYNLRFEDPAGSNEILKSYARDIVAAKSVRREEINNRKKHRDAQREKKEAEKRKKEEEKARMRRLKIEEMEERVKMIKKAAGIRGKALDQKELFELLNDGWDNEKWTAAMSKYFGENYYADPEVESNSRSNPDSEKSHKKKIKKPKWEEEIEINDILPEFKEEEAINQIKSGILESGEEAEDSSGSKTSKTRKKNSQMKKYESKAAQLERTRIEELIDSHLDINIVGSAKQSSRFRYRETSPVSFGLTARDILMAPDTSLNQYAGLKKMATFRDAEKKRRDKRNLSKKARLRQWRKDTFGNEHGPEIVNVESKAPEISESTITEKSGGNRKKKKSRSRRKRGSEV